MPRKNKPGLRVEIFDKAARDRIAKHRRSHGRSRKHESKRSDVPLDRPTHREPQLTADYARDFVKMLIAGVPPMHAISYFAPDYWLEIDDAARAKWLTKWTSAKLVVHALNTLNGGAWEELDKDKRLELARDKGLAQLAYFIYTHDYSTLVDRLDVAKHDSARRDLNDYLTKRQGGDAESPWMVMLRQVIEGKVGAGKPFVPPQLGEIPVFTRES